MQKKSSALEWVAVGIVVLLLVGIAGAIASIFLSRTTAQAPDSVPVVVHTRSETPPSEVAEAPEPPASTVPPTSPASAEAPPATAEPAAPPTAQAAAAPAYEPKFEPSVCPMDGLPEGATVECGYLIVPEDRSDADSADIRLAVAIIRSQSASPSPDPLIYLAGGPGGSALGDLQGWIDHGYASQRDFILFDQRGTGYSEPSLNCTEIEEWTYKYLNNPEWFLRNQTLRCSRRLRKDGIKVSAYNSAASAADLDDLRRALGYDQINLLGISYGTRLALTTMRDFPQHVRSVVLDSTYPPNVDSFAEQAANTVRAFDQLFDGCAADPQCNTAYPGLRESFYALVDALNEEPAEVILIDPDSGMPAITRVYGNDVVGIIFLSLYSTDIIPVLPRVIHEAAHGSYDSLALLLQLAFERGFDTADIFSEGMYYSVQCKEEMTFVEYKSVISAAESQPSLTDYFVDGFELERVMCNFWGAGEAAPIENEPVRSDIPTLVLAGQYDPVTPPAWGMLAAETLGSSYFYEFPGFGHGVSILGNCPTQLTQAFVNNPTVAPDASCIAAIGPPAFILP